MESIKTKRIVLTFLKTIAFLLLLAAVLGGISRVVERKSSREKYKAFFAQEENFDVLFLGSSHVINGVFPMELWNGYGMVSYNFGGHGNEIPTTYWTMQNALDYTSPKLIVIDAFNMDSGRKISELPVNAHLSFDSFPFSYNKLRSMLDLFDDPEATDIDGNKYYGTRWEYLWNFLIYHDRWADLGKSDFTDEDITDEKGAESRIAVTRAIEYEPIPDGQMITEDSVGQEYLKKMIDDCKARGIEVLITVLPFPADEAMQMSANTAEKIAEQYGVNCINFLKNGVVDPATDFYDWSSHLNPSGARKVTEYLGRYISENYDIPDRRGDPSYQTWDEDYARYLDFKKEKLLEQQDLDTELMLLSDKGYNLCAYIKEGSLLYENETAMNLIDNLSVYCGGGKAAADAGGDGALLIVVDNTAAKTGYYPLSAPTSVKASFGDIEFEISQDGQRHLYIGDNPDRLPYDWEAEPDLRITAFNSTTGEIVAQTDWCYRENLELLRVG